MRFNKTELISLAAQPSHKFEKEGVMFIRERQDGFFRKTETPTKKTLGCYGSGFAVKKVTMERWCRLRGNLLFYFKSRDHWSEPAGLIVLENCEVKADDQELESTLFGIILKFGSGSGTQNYQHLSCYTREDRDSWIQALQSSSHRTMKARLDSLKGQLQRKMNALGYCDQLLPPHNSILNQDGCSTSSARASRSRDEDFYGCSNLKSSVIPDVCHEVPLLEMSLSCDNLLCDALGRAPSCRLVVWVRNETDKSISEGSLNNMWMKYCQTEVIERSSNPCFLRTTVFRKSDGLFLDQTVIKIAAHDLREKFTSTSTLLGTTTVKLKELKFAGKKRLKLSSPNPEGRSAGFVSLTSWAFDSRVPGSADSTPIHFATKNSSRQSPEIPEDVDVPAGRERAAVKASQDETYHRRSHSLPPSMYHKSRIPNHGSLSLLFANMSIKTYNFHSGLGGDIAVHELMLESKLSFTFPQQLLSLWICEEKELVHEIAGIGELKGQWHDCQMDWLENHLNIINRYSQALENLDGSKGLSLRKSTSKGDSALEFVPVNLHLQRMWIENDSLRKSGFYDSFTHGAFTSFGQKSPGLIKMLKELKAPQKNSAAWCSRSDKLQMAEDTLAAIRRVRRDVVDCMRLLMKAAKERKTGGVPEKNMFLIVEDMLRKTKCLCSLLDSSVVEETMTFLEDNKVTVKPEKDEFAESVAEFMQRNKMRINLHQNKPLLGFNTLQTPCTEFISKELRTPEIDSYYGSANVVDLNLENMGEGAADVCDFWRTYSAYTSGYQSVDRLSDIDEFEESFKYLSVVDKTKHYYTLCRAASPIDTPPESPHKTPKREEPEPVAQDEGIEANKAPEDVEVDEMKPELAQEKVEEPKTQDIVTDSPSGLHYRAGDEPEPIDLTHLNIEAAMMCLASKVRQLCGRADSPSLCSRTFRFRELDGTTHKLKQPNGNGEKQFSITDVPKKPIGDEKVLSDWAEELRPSMTKLRQGMDSLCKTARLVCSVLRLQQTGDAISLSHAIKYRRDVCFSQALTSLVSALMAKFWCHNPPDLPFLSICMQLGPLVCFESLLSMHGEDVMIFNDVIVAVEDLRNVEFTLVLVDDKQAKLTKSSSSGQKPTFLETYPMPRVTGSRSNLKVMLPVPDFIYSQLESKSATFSVIPVFFNVGINENATIAAKLGSNGQQEKNNLDNFKTLAEYHRRLKKLEIPSPSSSHGAFGGKLKRGSFYDNEPEIEDLLVNLKEEVSTKKNKNVEILQLANNISRRMHGLRLTNCKSGKDRTSMATTLEQAQILLRGYDLAEHEYQKALDTMRSEGTRRDNTEKNCGKRVYAFNSLQLSTFPHQYRPPVGTYGNAET